MMVVHEGMRFYCISKNCDKSFTQKHNLIKHIRTAHGEDVELDLSSALMYPKIKMDLEGGDLSSAPMYPKIKMEPEGGDFQ